MADGNAIVIRPLADSDAAAFKALRLKAIQDSPSAVQPTYEEEAARTLDDMRHRIRATEHEVVFGAFRGDALIGVTGLRRHVPVQAAHKAVLWGCSSIPHTGAAAWPAVCWTLPSGMPGLRGCCRSSCA